jgi:hypothetical protein
MGQTICGIVVNALPKFSNEEQFDLKKLKTAHKKIALQNLSPKDLTIGFHNGGTAIFLDMIFYKNISEEAALTDLEKDVNNIFPGSKFLIVVINDTAGFTGYSLVENGAKRRTKAVVNGEIFLDYGELYSKEIELYESFIEHLKMNTTSFPAYEAKYAELGPVERSKYYLMTRDNYCRRVNIENNFNYTSGSMEEHIIEQEFSNIMGCTCFDLEGKGFIEFERRKLNFKKDSLKEYLFVASQNLISDK